MTSTTLNFAGTVMIVLLTSGCVREGGFVRKDTVGSLMGAVAGGLVGARVGTGAKRMLATALAGMAGSVMRATPPVQLDPEDRDVAREAAMRVLRGGFPRPTTWNNPQSGHMGTLREAAGNAHKRPCRDLIHIARAGGRRLVEVQRWCSTGAGRWRLRHFLPDPA